MLWSPSMLQYLFPASDGQQIYLHSLNARILVHQYGSLQNCPETITARIVEIEGISMNEVGPRG